MSQRRNLHVAVCGSGTQQPLSPPQNCIHAQVLHGAAGSSLELPLANHPDNFARGRYDTFIVNAGQVRHNTSTLQRVGTRVEAQVIAFGATALRTHNPSPKYAPALWVSQDLGPLVRLRIGHDGRGSRPRWHLDHVSVRRLGGSEPCALFPASEWGGAP